MKVGKVALVLTLALGIVLAPPAADAQQAGKIYRIGLLSPGPRLAPEEDSSSPLWAALKDRGWIEGQNLTIERRYDEGRAERLPELAVQLVRLNVDVIWARAPQAAVAAKNATKSIPIVFTGVVDPVALGLVNTLARPGGNVTGVTFATGTEVGAKELEFLREIAPGTTRVAFIYNAGNPAAALYVPALETAGRRLGIEVQSFGVRQPDDYEGAFRRIIEARCEALALIGDPLSLSQRRQIIDFASRNRLPSVFGFRQFVVDGGLMSYGWYLPEVYGRLAAYLDKILKGAKPGDLPVEQPTKFELVINLKTAKALGLTIPQSVLIRADEVIQ